MQNYIVAFDMSDPAVFATTNLLYRGLNNCAMVDVNMVNQWPPSENGCRLYIVDHGNGRQFGDYTNPRDLMREYPDLHRVFNAASEVWLVSCSTANEAQIILRDGFQGATFARNLKAYDRTKTVHAAVGPVVASNNVLYVETPGNAIGFASNRGWVTY